jgi:hypothetical protein
MVRRLLIFGPVGIAFAMHVAAWGQHDGTERRTCSEISGVYVLGAEKHSPAELERFLKDPAIDGFSLRAGWGDVEPREGAYDWSVFDRVIAAAANSGKKIMLRILPGVKTPAWVYEAGAKRFDCVDVNPYHATEGETISMPVPWDPVYLNKWKRLVAAFGAHYANERAVTIVAITGASGGGEMHLGDKDNASHWDSVGYSDQALIGAWKEAIDAFVAAFPHQHLSVAISKPVNFGNPRTVIEQVVRACEQAGCSIQGNWLAAKTRPRNPLYREVTMFGASHPVGFQTLSAAGIARFGGDLRTAVDLAVRAHACYLEIYPADVMKYPQDVAYAHEQLTRGRK